MEKELREQALAKVTPTSGRIGRTEFDWIMDGDARLGPMLEAFLPTEADYCWIPFTLLGSLQIEKPRQINHFIWAPAHFTWRDGNVLHGFIPARYVGSESTDDPAHALARDFDRQVAEIQIRIAVLNRYTALGIPVTEPVG